MSPSSSNCLFQSILSQQQEAKPRQQLTRPSPMAPSRNSSTAQAWYSLPGSWQQTLQAFLSRSGTHNLQFSQFLDKIGDTCLPWSYPELAPEAGDNSSNFLKEWACLFRWLLELALPHTTLRVYGPTWAASVLSGHNLRSRQSKKEEEITKN